MSIFDTGQWRRQVDRAAERRRLEYAVQNAVGPIVDVTELSDDQLHSMMPARSWAATPPAPSTKQGAEG